MQVILQDIPRARTIYVKNPYDVDIYFVLNETSKGDWSPYFKETRALP